MPSEGSRLHVFTVVSKALRLGRQLLVPAILGGVSVGDGLNAAALWTFAILAVPSLLLAIAHWLVFRYRLAEDELTIDSGVLFRRRRVIPLARIQNVELKQSFPERLARAAELRIETASGGHETEASLAVLGLDEAQRLRTELRRRRAIARGELEEDAIAAAGREPEHFGETEVEGPRSQEAARPEETLLHLSLVDLVIAGATSNEAGLIAAGLATIVEVVDDLGAGDRANAWLEGVFQQGASAGAVGAVVMVAALVLAFVVFGWLLSIGATVIRFWDFTLIRAGDDLRREYGLFSRNHSTVPLERVQVVRIEETLLRRPLGLAALKIETAGAGPKQRKHAQGDGAEAYVPITRRKDVGRLLRAVFDDARFDNVKMLAVAPVSRRRSFVRLAVPVVLATAIIGWVHPTGLALAALLVPAWWIAGVQYRARAWARTDGYAIVRNGVLTRANSVIPERKIQTLHLKANPFQRRLDLATLVIDTAGGGRVARAVDLPRHTAEPLFNELAARAG